MNYSLAQKQLLALLENENDLLANMANFSAFINDNLSDINWAGFYLKRGRQLVLGPFQGKVACVRIDIGKGVCGTAAQKLKTILVDDVHLFAGHIACDSASNSELVIPILKNGNLFGVFDIDSPKFARFRDKDKIGMEALINIFIQNNNFGNELL